MLTQSSAWSLSWTTPPHDCFCRGPDPLPVDLGFGVQEGLLVRPAMASGWYARYDQGYRALGGQDGPANKHTHFNHGGDGGVAICIRLAKRYLWRTYREQLEPECPHDAFALDLLHTSVDKLRLELGSMGRNQLGCTAGDVYSVSNAAASHS